MTQAPTNLTARFDLDDREVGRLEITRRRLVEIGDAGTDELRAEVERLQQVNADRR